jgi:hypothetical protein
MSIQMFGSSERVCRDGEGGNLTVMRREYLLDEICTRRSSDRGVRYS